MDVEKSVGYQNQAAIRSLSLFRENSFKFGLLDLLSTHAPRSPDGIIRVIKSASHRMVMYIRRINVFVVPILDSVREQLRPTTARLGDRRSIPS